MEQEVKTLWRWRHARRLFGFLRGSTLLTIGLLSVESLLFQNPVITVGLVAFLIFLGISWRRLYLQYRRLPKGSKGKMIRTIKFLEDSRIIMGIFLGIMILLQILRIPRFLN